MKKRSLIAIVVVLLLFIIGGYFLVQSSQSAKITEETLSARSKEYLQKRSENEATSLKYAAVNDKGTSTDPADQVLTVDGCFEITIPFRITNSRVEANCFLHVALRTPRGTMNAYRRFEAAKTIAEIPGISMRRSFKDIYTEKKEVINGQEYAVFSKKDEGYAKNVFTLTPGGYMIINVLASGGSELDVQLLEVLSSIKLLEGAKK